MEYLNQFAPDFATLFALGFGVTVIVGFAASGVVSVVRYITKLMGG